MVSIHTKRPERRQVAPREIYTQYRDDLRKDFNNSCGYCDDSDFKVDRVSFHIDHFAPKKKFPELQCTYSNLVYACRFCNVRKSYHWVGNDSAIHNDGVKGFVDPCSLEYGSHLERLSSGRIVAKSELGKYMIRRLNLGLLRHELLWMARRARLLRDEIDPLINKYKAAGFDKSDSYKELLEKFRDLTLEIESYEFGANR